MAERRMFANGIIDSDTFLDMPLSAQALYFHLGMKADDDGFVSGPKKIQRMVSCTEDDLRLLILKGFIIPFDSGVCVITHWKLHNYIQKDRYRPTIYDVERSQLELAANKMYTTRVQGVSELDTGCIQGVSNLDAQVRGDEGSGVERRGVEIDAAEGDACLPEPDSVAKPVAHIRGQYGWVRLTDEQYNRLIQDFGVQAAEDAIGYVDESAQTTGNKNRWKDWNLVIRKCIREGWGKRGSRRDNGLQTSNPFMEMLQERGGDLF